MYLFARMQDARRDAFGMNFSQINWYRRLNQTESAGLANSDSVAATSMRSTFDRAVSRRDQRLISFPSFVEYLPQCIHFGRIEGRAIDQSPSFHHSSHAPAARAAA